MPYHPTTIHSLSQAQISKLLNGHAVRITHGHHHKVHLSTEQHKKLMKAHAKGKSSTITFDPFQIEGHQHLRGKHTHKPKRARSYKRNVHPKAEHLEPKAEHLEHLEHREEIPKRNLKSEIGDLLNSLENTKIHNPPALSEEDLAMQNKLAELGLGLKRHRGRPRKAYSEPHVKGRQKRHVGHPRHVYLGKGTLKDWGMQQYNQIPEEYHPGIESLGRAGLKQAGFGLRGKGTLKDWGMEQYNRIPEEYHPGIESLGRAGLKQAGFGLKKRKSKKHMMMAGEGFWDDVRGKFQNTFTPDLGRRVARGAIEYGLPAAVGALTTASGNPEFAPFTSAAMKYAAPSIERSAGLGLRKRRVGGSLHSMAKSAFRAAAPTIGRVLKPIAKQVAHEVVKYGEAAAGPAAAAAAVAAGQPELAPYAFMAGNMMAHHGAKSANKYIEGLGLARNAAGRGMHKRGRPRKTHGKALSPAGYSY